MPKKSGDSVARPIAIGLLLLAAGLVGTCLWLTDQELWQHNPLGWIPLFPARIVLLGLSALLLVVAFARGIVRSRCSLWVQRVCATLLAGSLAVLFLEVAFMFVPRSHNVGYTLASGIWFADFWGKPNALGYRDVEHQREPGKKLVFTVGDSFTAGGGLRSVASRFSNLLQQQQPSLQVLNLGMNGADTIGEFRHLVEHPLQPDVVVLQWGVNDIEGAILRAGHQVPAFAPYQDMPSVKLRWLVRSSYLANFAYWAFPHSDLLAYEQQLERMLVDPKVLQLHLQDLQQFVDYATQRHVQLVVVLFPMLHDLEKSRPMIAPVRALFTQQGVPVIEVADLVQDMSPSSRMVSSQDAHPSVRVNELVAEALSRVLQGP